MRRIETTVATYNIHRCHGTDRRLDPDRVRQVIMELGADVVALQEVDSGIFVKNGVCQAEHMGAVEGFQAIRGPTIRRQAEGYGNLLLSRLPVVDFRLVDLGVRFREPRGAIFATLKREDQLFNVVNVHLGLSTFERRIQYRRLAILLADTDLPAIILGDFNEWSPIKRTLPALGLRSSSGALVRSFPAWRPLLPLDRVYTRPEGAVTSMTVHRSALSRVASDHLPVIARVQFPDKTEETSPSPIR